MEIWSVHGMTSLFTQQKTQQTRFSVQHVFKEHLLLQTFNMVVEIPRFSQAKFEINRESPLNPIRQDVTSLISGSQQRWRHFEVKTDEVLIRFLFNVFPWHGHVCNYGALPQTWENPYHQVGNVWNEKKILKAMLNVGSMDGKDWRQRPSWCLRDWHFAKTYWYSYACQVCFLLYSLCFLIQKMCHRYS